MNEKIPKIIHYCWFGNGPKNNKTVDCINSWKKYLPDYEIIEWNESNYDINKNKFMKQAYEHKKWAYVSDFARLDVLHQFGGIYLDSDVEVLKSINRFLDHGFFSSFEGETQVPTGIMGAKKGNKFVAELLAHYEFKEFVKADGTLDYTPNTNIITDYCVNEYGLVQNNTYQSLKNEVYFYPSEYFSPKSWDTRIVNLTENSYTIHHFEGSWRSKKTRLKTFTMDLTRNILGNNIYNKLMKTKK